MASQFDWKVKFKGTPGSKHKLDEFYEKIRLAAYDGGATEVAHFIECELGYNLDNLDVDYRDADTHYLGVLSIIMLSTELWNKGMSFVSRCFLSGAFCDDESLIVSFYGPESCDRLMSLITENCDFIESYEISGGEDEDYDDEEYEDDEY